MSDAGATYGWLLPHFSNVRHQPGSQWASARCPWHDDAHNSLGINVTTGFLSCKACHAKCSAREYCAKEGKAFEGPQEEPRLNEDTERCDAQWDYRDEHGKPVYRVKRYDAKPGVRSKKTFRPWHYLDGMWHRGKGGARPPIYNLPEVLEQPKSELLYVVEGEKAVDALAYWGRLATTTPEGATGFSRADTSHLSRLRGRRVVLLPDNDIPGENYCKAWGAALRDAGSIVVTVHLPGLERGEDIYDWIWTHRHTKDELDELVAAAFEAGTETLLATGVLEEATLELSRGKPWTEVRGRLFEQLLSLGNAQETQFCSAADCVEAFEERILSGDSADLIHTGIAPLDGLLRGLERREMVVLGAAPGFGKTALAGQMALDVALAGHDVLFISQEMSKSQLGERLCAMHWGVEPRRVTAEQAGELKRIIKGLPLTIWPGKLDWPGVVSVARQWRWMKPRPRLLVLDYLQIVEYSKMSENEFLLHVSPKVKNLAVDLDVTVLCISQGSRQARDREEPDMSFFRGSSGIECAADRALVLWPEPGEDQTLDVRNCRCYLVKNRFGPARFVRIIFNGPLTKFSATPLTSPSDSARILPSKRVEFVDYEF